MKITFNTIWVDDNTDFVGALKMSLENWLDEKGLKLNVFEHTKADGVLENIRGNEIELIIVDYKLPGRDGDKLIEEIRDSGFYQDIIFYSGSKLPDTKFDGVFYVSKEDANKRIKELIELKLRRFSDPASVRGWIVADSIELESMITELLTLCFTERVGFTFADRLLHRTDTPSIDFYGKHKLVNGMLKDYIALLDTEESNNRQRIDVLRSYRKIFNTFADEIIHVRNALAHQKVEESASGAVIKTMTSSAASITLNEESFIKMRKDIRKHHTNLSDLLSILRE